MTEAEAVFVLESLFGMYVAGFCAGYLINVVKILMEKI